GYTRNQVLAQNTVEFSASSDLYYTHTEHNLGNLLADAFNYAVENADDFDEHPVDVAIVPSGCVRDTFATGDITVEDVFNAYSLGIGLDGIPGYPLISMYLTGAELKTGAEIDASVSDFMRSARLYLNGVNFSFNPDRIILNKVTDCYMTDDMGNRVEIEDDKLYRVVCDLYSGQMLGAVTDVSYGILSIQPKFADGTPIENIEDAIITSNGAEVKAWVSIAQYLESLEDTNGDGIADVPDYYIGTQGRKIVETSHTLPDLLKSPNKYAIIIILAVIVAILLVIVIICLVIKLIKNLMRKRRK
ncbi:MAG: 5'-nucleotidase C-terminal domain-containing protein, partial [Acetatifactor sp.]|nr:5'-nucleotidase C-terminal domain-containing protein [Acetatifactor sp.]